MSTIFNKANNIVLIRDANTFKSVSNSGFARQQKSGPSFYSFEVNLPIMDKTDYRSVENELLTLDDGVNFLTTSIPAKTEITGLQGAYQTSGTPYVVANSGTVIQIGNMAPSVTNQLKAGDFIKFSSGTKVYQVKSDANSNSGGVVEITLNTGLISTIVTGTSGDTITVGNNVQFKLMLNNRPEVNIIPGTANSNLYTYNSFNFKEVL